MDLRSKADAGMDYVAYRARVDEVVAAGRTTGPEQSEKRINATKLNQARMRRLDKTLVLLAELEQALSVAPAQTWLVLTEAWCGDASQNLPALALMAKHAPQFTLQLLLRDEHLDLMERYLTGGAQSIPKLIAIDGSGKELFIWGPRPAEAHRIVMDNKARPESERMPYEQLVETVHRWYNEDRTSSLQREFVRLLS
jgi:hypothetical protein